MIFGCGSFRSGIWLTELDCAFLKCPFCSPRLLRVSTCRLASLVFAATSLSSGGLLQYDCTRRHFRPWFYQSEIYVVIEFPTQRLGWKSLHSFELWDCYNHHNPLPNIALANLLSHLELHFLVALWLWLDRTWQFLDVRDVVEAEFKMRG